MARNSGCGMFLWFLCLLTGCAPVLSEIVVAKSDRSLSFEELLRDPGKHAGKIVVLGGTIVNSLKNPAGGRQLEVLQRPLGFRMEPQLNDQTGGRFLVQFDKELDERSFPKNRKITVAAEVVGRETRSLDQTEYTYPLLRAREYHLWSEDYSMPAFHFGFGVSGNF